MDNRNEQASPKCTCGNFTKIRTGNYSLRRWYNENDMAVAKQSRQKGGSIAAVPARKGRPNRLQGSDLRRALEELRETKSETRAQELKKAISESICGV
jgi:hypothetical protein